MTQPQYTSILHGSVPGESLAQVLVAHAAIGGAGWLVQSWQTPLALFPLAACGWISVRAAGVFAGSWWPSLVTLALAAGLVLILPAELPVHRWWREGLFAPPVYGAVLVIILLLDVADFRHRANGVPP